MFKVFPSQVPPPPQAMAKNEKAEAETGDEWLFDGGNGALKNRKSTAAELTAKARALGPPPEHDFLGLPDPVAFRQNTLR